MAAALYLGNIHLIPVEKRVLNENGEERTFTIGNVSCDSRTSVENKLFIANKFDENGHFIDPHDLEPILVEPYRTLLEEGHDLAGICCGHLFEKTVIGEWFYREEAFTHRLITLHTTCPLCREEAYPEERVLIGAHVFQAAPIHAEPTGFFQKIYSVSARVFSEIKLWFLIAYLNILNFLALYSNEILIAELCLIGISIIFGIAGLPIVANCLMAISCVMLLIQLFVLWYYGAFNDDNLSILFMAFQIFLILLQCVGEIYLHRR